MWRNYLGADRGRQTHDTTFALSHQTPTRVRDTAKALLLDERNACLTQRR